MAARAPIQVFLEFLLTSAPYHFLSKLLAAFPHDHRQTNGPQSEWNESCSKDYLQTEERNWLSQVSNQ